MNSEKTNDTPQKVQDDMLRHPDLKIISLSARRREVSYLILVVFGNGVIATATFRVRVVNEEDVMCNPSNGWVSHDVIAVLEVFV
jgi:hypothetical protein